MFEFKNQKQVVSFITDAIKSNKRIGVYGDHDVDGIMSLMIFKDMFSGIKYDSVLYYNYAYRTHAVEPGFEQFCYQFGIDVAIICDTGSSDLEMLKRITDAGIDCVVLDHHTSIYSYEDFPKNVHLINTQFDNLLFGIDNKMCGGGISFVIATEVLDFLGAQCDKGYFAAYGLIAQYADIIQMNTEFGHYIYQTCAERKVTPPVIELFLDGAKNITKRFAEFTFAPKINAAFRREEFGLLNDLFILNKSNRSELVQRFKDLHKDTINLVNDLINSVQIEHVNGIVLANLSVFLNNELPTNFIVNHKGRIANSLSDKFKKPCIAVCDSGSNITGSLRDIEGRNFLQFFVHKINAGGHPPAFGFVVEYDEWDLFKSILETLEYNKEASIPSPIVEMPYGIDLLEVQQIARDNEFSNAQNPPTLIRIPLKRIIESKKYGLAYIVYSDGLTTIWAPSDKAITKPCSVSVLPFMRDTLKLSIVWR